ncbi:MAG: hypothetical protein MI867_12560 [Pseudomonadales bacterium]|nr:hypothetical protein [Pseudomonadales bacterium]
MNNKYWSSFVYQEVTGIARKIETPFYGDMIVNAKWEPDSPYFTEQLRNEAANQVEVTLDRSISRHDIVILNWKRM